MPVVGLGTFGSDHYSIESIAKAVKGAIDVGYRHIDCAAVYGNEHLVGQALRDAMQSGVRREDLVVLREKMELESTVQYLAANSDPLTLTCTVQQHGVTLLEVLATGL